MGSVSMWGSYGIEASMGFLPCEFPVSLQMGSEPILVLMQTWAPSQHIACRFPCKWLPSHIDFHTYMGLDAAWVPNTWVPKYMGSQASTATSEQCRGV
jgi:hypothetical protein